MLKLELKDLTVEGLEKIARLYGLPTGGNVNREMLLQKITQRMSPKAEIGFVDLTKPWYQTPSVCVAIIAAVFTLVGVIASCMMVHTATVQLNYNIAKDIEQREKDRKLQWQQQVVHSIIEKETKKQPSGVTLDDIRGKYIIEVTAAKKTEELGGELDEFTLKGVLLEFLANQRILQTVARKHQWYTGKIHSPQ